MKRIVVVMTFLLCLSANFFDGKRFAEEKSLREKKAEFKEAPTVVSAGIQVLPEVISATEPQIKEEKKRVEFNPNGPCFARELHPKHNELIKALGLRVPEQKMVDISEILSVPNVCDNKKILSPTMTWAELEREMMAPVSIEHGIRFYFENKFLLDQISKHYGIRASVLVAITRIESDFGRNRGVGPVLLVLYNGYFYKNKKDNLNRMAVWFEFVEKNKTNILSPGSHAGAFGLTQFMPQRSSLHYAVDWDKDGVIDLYAPPDALASSASHLIASGWGRKPNTNALMGYNNSSEYARITLAYEKKLRKFIE